MISDYRLYEQQQRLEHKGISDQLWERKYLDLAYTYYLDEFEFNWQTGAIYWPSTVAGPRYALHRQRLSRLIDQAIRYGMADSQICRAEIKQACDIFRKQLTDDATKAGLSARDEYSTAKRFLLGLKYAPYLMSQAETGIYLTSH